ncbi:hypothetical protein WJX72_005133 [[Myrmecia] bisecta]|uniref:Uncharacterized protein n=1 Tax=[Myrmecia] bisecta TaxID=41462 RepID=A0AAW1PXU1_9CHLO
MLRHAMSDFFGDEYLGDATEEDIKWPIKGRVWGQALLEFGYKDKLPAGFTKEFKVHGIPQRLSVSPADKHFPDVNLLGTDFLDAINGVLKIDYGPADVVLISKGLPYR